MYRQKKVQAMDELHTGVRGVWDCEILISMHLKKTSKDLA